MRVLVGCEFSGIVRNAFAARGHDAWSCDIQRCERGGQHIRGNVLDVLKDGWDLAIFHPPCTYLCSSGALWWRDKQSEQRAAMIFFQRLFWAPIKKIAVENPVGIMSSVFRQPTQIIQPWQFGHNEVKTTCLWLRNLPRLVHTKIMPGRRQVCFRAPDSSNRSKMRSRTYDGIAEAMAAQWGRVSA